MKTETQKEIRNYSNGTLYYEVIFTNTSFRLLTQEEYNEIENLIKEKLKELGI